MEHRASFTLAEPLAAGTSLSFGLTVLSSAANDEMTHIGVNVSAGDGKQPFVDKRRSSLRAAVPPVFLDLMTTDPLSPSLTTNITAFVDGHVLETFFDDSLALTTTVYPQSEESTRFGLFLRCEGDVTVVASAQAWALRPIVLKQRSTTAASEVGAGERKSPGAKTDDCSSGLASRQWSSIRAGIFDELKGEDAQPFMLTGSPVEAWPALKRWTPAFVADQIGEVPNVRRSEQPRFLFWTIDTFSSELARNEEFWQLVDGGNTELGSSPIAHKNFRWARPHRLHPTVSGARFSKSVAGRGKRGRYTYAAVDPYETRAARALLDDISPLEELAARREDDHRRWRINIWMGSENSTATPHYDSYHNIVKW